MSPDFLSLYLKSRWRRRVVAAARLGDNRSFAAVASLDMRHQCRHLDTIRTVTPSALGCEECLKMGDAWLHLRLCRICGHVGCCDQSKNKHATKHFHRTKHPIIEGYDPPDGWGWCYVDEVMLDLSRDMTTHNGNIPRYY